MKNKQDCETTSAESDKRDSGFRCFLSGFENTDLPDLIELIRKGDQDAHEEFYLRLNDDICDIAYGLSARYGFIEDDESEFFCAVVTAAESAIRCYDREKGDFFHLWRRIIKREKIKVLRRASKPGHQNKANTVFEGTADNPDFFDVLIRSAECGFADDSFVEAAYLSENVEKIMSFVRHHYGADDVKMISLWMNFYTLEEISATMNLDRRRVLSRLYTIIDSIRANIDRSALDFS